MADEVVAWNPDWGVWGYHNIHLTAPIIRVAGQEYHRGVAGDDLAGEDGGIDGLVESEVGGFAGQKAPDAMCLTLDVGSQQSSSGSGRIIHIHLAGVDPF
jgi:hypothetical protein